MYGTPVLGANIGGIPELIQNGVTGELFESGNVQELTMQVARLWKDSKLTMQYSRNCQNVTFDTIEQYCEQLIAMYSSE